jgi:hypothetical protein
MPSAVNVALYRQSSAWPKMQQQAMAQDFANCSIDDDDVGFGFGERRRWWRRRVAQRGSATNGPPLHGFQASAAIVIPANGFIVTAKEQFCGPHHCISKQS